MFRICVLLYGLSLTEASTIQITGKVELDSKLSKLVKDFYSQLVDSGLAPPLPEHKNESDESEHLPALSSSGNKEASSNSCEESAEEGIDVPIKGKKHKKKRDRGIVEESREFPGLDNLMKNDLEKLHRYGHHKSPGKTRHDVGKPLNNVNL